MLLYDVTSTYFEGQADGNPQAQRGYSRDHRLDCKQVCIARVVTFDGFPLGYEVFAGNMRNPRQSGHRFRRKATTDSDRKRPPNPNEGGHPVDRVSQGALSAI